MDRQSTHKSGDDAEAIPLLQGTLDLLILKTLQSGSRHGYGIVKAIKIRSQDALQVEQGSLYPSLHRLLKKGWIVWEWGETETGRRGKYYRLTTSGKRELESETRRWDAMVEAIGYVLNPAG